MENTSYSPAQLTGVTVSTKRTYDRLSEVMGKNPTFKEFMHTYHKYTDDKEKMKQIFNYIVKGWELNKYPIEDYQSVYDDLFDPMRAEKYVHSEAIVNLFNEKSRTSIRSFYLEQQESFIKNAETTVEKKNFKTLIADFVGLFFGAVIFLGLVGFFGDVIYEKYIATSQQYKSLVFGILTFGLLGYIFFIIASKDSLGVSFDKKVESYGIYVVFIPIIISAIVPVFIILVNILIFILSFWFFWFAIVLLLLLIVIWFSPIKYIKKTLLTVLIILTIYFFFEAKDILKFDFQTYFDNKKFHLDY